MLHKALNSSFDPIPNEIILYAFQFGDVSTRLALSATCHLLCDVGRSDPVWRMRLCQLFPEKPQTEPYFTTYSNYNKMEFNKKLNLEQAKLLKLIKLGDIEGLKKANITVKLLDSFPGELRLNPFYQAGFFNQQAVLDFFYELEKQGRRSFKEKIHWAAQCNQGEAVVAEIFAECNWRKPPFYSALLDAIRIAIQCDHAVIMKAFAANQVNLNCCLESEKKLTPLLVCAEKGKPKVLEALLEMPDVNANLRNVVGMSALHLAAKQPCFETLAMLCQHEKTSKQINQMSNRMFATMTGVYFLKRGTPLHVFIEHSKKMPANLKNKLFAELLKIPFVDVNIPGKCEFTPLHLAAEVGDPDLVAQLLAVSNVNVLAKDESDNIPLDLVSGNDEAKNQIRFLLLEAEDLLGQLRAYEVEREIDAREHIKTISFFVGKIELGYSRDKKLEAINELINLVERRASIDELKALKKLHPAINNGRLKPLYEKVIEFAGLCEKFAVSATPRQVALHSQRL